jgi:uncharacterized protein
MTQPGGAPPGWYGTEQGWRWWDGTAWGPLAPPAPPGTVVSEADAGRTAAIFSHLGILFGGFILPLVIYLTEGKRNGFVRGHSREALNFQIFYMILGFVGFAIFWIGIAGIAASNSRGSGPPAIFGFMFLYVGGLWVLGLVQSIIGAVRAGQGEPFRYPVTIRFIRH